MCVFRSVILPALTLGLVLGVASSGRAQDTEPAVINLINVPAALTGEVYYAQDLGFFKAAGLDVRITAMRSSPAVISALASGAADVGFAAVGTAASAYESGIPVLFIAPGGMNVSPHPTSELVGPTNTTIHTASDLNGKTVAVTGLADLSYYTTEAWIEKNGGNLSRVKFVEIPFPEMAGALVQHRVDAAVIPEPFLTEAKNEVRVIADVNSATGSRYMMAGWLADEAWIRSHPSVAARFAAVIRQTAQWANTHHNESRLILQRYMRISPEVAATMRLPEFALALDPKLLQPPIHVAAEFGTQKSLPPATDLIWQALKQ